MTPIHFAHANGFPAGSYRRLFQELERGYRVLALDQVGHDPLYPVGHNWHRLAEQLIAHLEAQADEPVVAVGHSLGGVLSFLAVQRRPELFRALIMLDPPVLYGTSAGVTRLAKRLGFIDRLTPAGLSRGRRDHWPSRAEALAQLRRKRLFRDFDPDSLRDYIEHGTEEDASGARLRYRPEVEVEIFRNIPDDLQRYAPLRVPGAIVYGQGSDVVRLPELRRFARRHGLRLSGLPGGHMFPLERPATTGRFLRRLIPALLAA